MHSSKLAQRKKASLHPDTVAELKEAFALFDSDRKGHLDGRELKSAIRAMGFDVKSEQVRKLMTDSGKDPSQLISLEEFLDIMRDRMQQKSTREEVMKVFNLFDDEHLGVITFRSLKRISQEIGENISDDDLHGMIQEADRDGDGALSFEEFYRVMKRRDNNPLDCWDSSDDE